jgi:chromosome segregation ATPase
MSAALKSAERSFRRFREELSSVTEEKAKSERDLHAAQEKERELLARGNVGDASHRSEIGDVRLQIELFPRQIKTLEDAAANLVERELEAFTSLEHAIVAVRESDMTALVDKITKEVSAVISPYCEGDDNIAAIARHFASSMPAVHRISFASSWQTKSRPGMDRAVAPETYDRAVTDHADELLAIAARALSAGGTFLPPEFRSR